MLFFFIIGGIFSLRVLFFLFVFSNYKWTLGGKLKKITYITINIIENIINLQGFF